MYRYLSIVWGYCRECTERVEVMKLWLYVPLCAMFDLAYQRWFRLQQTQVASAGYRFGAALDL